MKNKTILESYPDEIIAKMEQKEREERSSLPGYINGNSFDLVFEDIKLWRVGEIKVSFKGGTPELHKSIAEVAASWSQYGDLTFDFGYNAMTGEFRKWTSRDTSHIKIGFEYRGYWSLVGTDSRDPRIVNPGDITLNLEDFDQGNSLTEDQKGTVLHEFGHAIGFHHEHQTQALECDFDWPKLYRALGGPPNYWPKHKVDHNLRQLTRGGMSYSAHDKHSIMHYSFPEWMFLNGNKSPCHTSRNHQLSDMDKRMMERAYPGNEEDHMPIIEGRIKNLGAILEEGKGLSKEGQNFHREHYDFLNRV